VKGVNACFGQDMQFARKRSKSGGRELHFEHSDYFLENATYTSSNITSFLYGCLVEVPGRKVRHEKPAYYFDT
jgi:hypothetical protein